MIWIEDDEPGFAHPPGLSVAEARDLDCAYWSPDVRRLPECWGCHYLCRECLSRTQPETYQLLLGRAK